MEIVHVFYKCIEQNTEYQLKCFLHKPCNHNVLYIVTSNKSTKRRQALSKRMFKKLKMQMQHYLEHFKYFYLNVCVKPSYEFDLQHVLERVYMHTLTASHLQRGGITSSNDCIF